MRLQLHLTLLLLLICGSAVQFVTALPVTKSSFHKLSSRNSSSLTSTLRRNDRSTASSAAREVTKLHARSSKLGSMASARKQVKGTKTDLKKIKSKVTQRRKNITKTVGNSILKSKSNGHARKITFRNMAKNKRSRNKVNRTRSTKIWHKSTKKARKNKSETIITLKKLQSRNKAKNKRLRQSKSKKFKRNQRAAPLRSKNRKRRSKNFIRPRRRKSRRSGRRLRRFGRRPRRFGRRRRRFGRRRRRFGMRRRRFGRRRRRFGRRQRFGRRGRRFGRRRRRFGRRRRRFGRRGRRFGRRRRRSAKKSGRRHQLARSSLGWRLRALQSRFKNKRKVGRNKRSKKSLTSRRRFRRYNRRRYGPKSKKGK